MNTTLRKEMHDYIDVMPESRLEALKPLLSDLVEYWKPVIEPANAEECAMIEEAMKDYPQDFEPFKPWPRETM